MSKISAVADSNACDVFINLDGANHLLTKPEFTLNSISYITLVMYDDLSTYSFATYILG